MKSPSYSFSNCLCSQFQSKGIWIDEEWLYDDRRVFLGKQQKQNAIVCYTRLQPAPGVATEEKKIWNWEKLTGVSFSSYFKASAFKK